MCAGGMGPGRIAKQMKKEKILCPTAYAYRKFGITHSSLDEQKRYTDITELTPELLRLFIRKIVVHEKSTKWSKNALQTIKIHYSDIGWIGGEVPQDKKSPRQEISA